MAGDWIPFRIDLPRSREVLAIARATGMNRHHVAGLLADFWGWASAETVDGLLPRLTVEDICETVGGTPEFWTAVAKEDWLVIDETGLRIPKFDRWLGKGAKSRMQKAQRQATWRAKAHTVDTPVDGQASTCPSTIEQDSTGEDSTEYETRRDDHLDSCSWEDAREVCNRKFKPPHGVDLSKKKPIGREDRSLLLKLGYLLAARKIPEWLIDNACQAVLHHDGEVDGIKYFTTVLFDGAQKKRIRLPALLAAVTVPEDLLTPAHNNGHAVSKPV